MVLRVLRQETCETWTEFHKKFHSDDFRSQYSMSYFNSASFTNRNNNANRNSFTKRIQEFVMSPTQTIRRTTSLRRGSLNLAAWNPSRWTK
mmetsp:Transcript_25285/g.62273  ORF Transcript_25285/g.62273 Transcript_25285/m.62273 type:complete len:91 (+) Transcript_25285:167-439(+)